MDAVQQARGDLAVRVAKGALEDLDLIGPGNFPIVRLESCGVRVVVVAGNRPVWPECPGLERDTAAMPSSTGDADRRRRDPSLVTTRPTA